MFFTYIYRELRRRHRQALLTALGQVSMKLPVVFPIHPRTRARIEQAGLHVAPGIQLCEPLGYLQFLGLMAQARLVLTDSGGIQEETTALAVPCLTLRANTERPITVTQGSNILLGADPDAIGPAVVSILQGRGTSGRVPDLWDGHAAQRIADIVCAGFRTLLEG